ncbi:hypothetical protein JOM56_000171 [Amanita muscaria]
MVLDLNHQQYHTAMRGDVTPRPFFSFPDNPILVRSTTVGIAHGISESGLAAADHLMPVYRIADCHTLTGTHNPQPQPLINNVQPSYYPNNLAVGTIQQSATNPTFTNAYNKGTAQEILGESGLAAANVMPVTVHRAENCHNLTNTHNAELQPLFSSVFINNIQSPYYPGDLAVGSIQQPPTMALADPTSANYYLTLDENTNSTRTFTNAYKGGTERGPSHDDEVITTGSTNPNGKESVTYFPLYDGNTVRWHCNLSGCQYVSRSKRDIKRHCSNLRHGGSREHKCEFCGNGFLRKDTLKRHVTETRCLLRQAQLKSPEDDLCE